MNDTRKIIFRVGSAVSLALAIAAAVFYSISYTNHYNTAIRHFDASPAVTAFVILFAVTVTVVVACSLAFTKQGVIVEEESNHIECFLLWLTAFMFIGFGVISLTEGSSAPVSDAVGPASFGPICTSMSGPMAIISAVPFALAASGSLRGSIAHKLTSFIPVLWGACLLFKYYFDLSEMPLNDPELALTSVCIAAMMVFFLSESRSAIGINSPAISVFGNLCAVTLTGCISTARIILSLTSGHRIPSLMENIVFFSVAVLALTRLLSFETKKWEPIVIPDKKNNSSESESPDVKPQPEAEQ